MVQQNYFGFSLFTSGIERMKHKQPIMSRSYGRLTSHCHPIGLKDGKNQCKRRLQCFFQVVPTNHVPSHTFFRNSFDLAAQLSDIKQFLGLFPRTFHTIRFWWSPVTESLIYTSMIIALFIESFVSIHM